MALPQLTPEQRADALAKAAATRKRRSGALAEVRAGDVTVAGVLSDSESPLQGARVRQVLLAVKGIGAVKADRILAGTGIDKRRRVGGLGVNQRAALAALFTPAAEAAA